MLRSIERKLIASNIVVFVCVIATLSTAVFVYIVHSLDAEAKEDVVRLATTAVTYMDSDDIREDGSIVPDFIEEDERAEHARQSHRTDYCLEWFDDHGKLVNKRGDLAVTLPFSMDGDFQVQDEPHALLVTRPAVLYGKTRGFARAAISLADTDQTIARLVVGLILGAVAGSIAGTAGVLALIRQSMRPIAANWAKLQRFTADVSHELRSPLMAIKTNSSVALKYDDGMRPLDKEKFKTILDASKQMTSTIEDLISLADSTMPPSPHAMADAGAIVTNLLDFECAEGTKSHDVKIDLKNNLWVSVEEAHFRRLLRNIIDNAFKYTPPGKGVSISGQRLKERVEIVVEDKGIGIDPKDLPHVFDRFWRASKDRSRTEDGGGSGLGLSIAQAIVERYGGSIKVTSDVGVGSKFIVDVPAASVAQQQPASVVQSESLTR